MTTQITETPAEIILIDRVTTKSGSVYEFTWLEPEWPSHGHRNGYVRKNGGTWEPISMVSVGFPIEGRMFWIREDGYTVHTSRIVQVEAVAS